jgi:hypothetical protein
MIEIRFAFFPTNQSKLHTVMITVARGTKLGLVSCATAIQHGNAGVIAALGLQPRSDGGVALQAFCIAGLLANFMARQTLRQTFKLRMCLGQRPGRNLRKSRVGE